MMALKPYLDRETLEGLIDDILIQRYMEFVYDHLRYYISFYGGDDFSIQVINDHDELKDKPWPERTEQVQDEIHYNSLKELFENYVMQDGTPMMDVIKASNVEWTA